jgi:hypothetical protein
VSIGLFLVGLVYLTRLIGGLSLPELPLTVPRWYPALTGGVWAAAAGGAGWGLLTGQRRAPAFARAAALAFLAWYWADRLLLARSDYARSTLAFSAGVTFIAAGLLFWVLARPAVRSFFGENGS